MTDAFAIARDGNSSTVLNSHSQSIGNTQRFQIRSVAQRDCEGFIRLGWSIISNRNLKCLACFATVEGQRAGGGSVILTGNRGTVSSRIIDSQSTRAATGAHDSYSHESNIFDHLH